ncbi:MAG: alpha/beta hydrolase [Actinobacteria bacterium]|nr:alpha/beta hydrolase [Actinomycetota bacterium]
MPVRHLVDPESWAAFESLRAHVPIGPGSDVPLSVRRQMYEGIMRNLSAAEPDPRVRWHDDEVGGVAVRIYRPRQADGRLPGLVHVHGGGMVVGSVLTDHADCLDLCARHGAVVVSVDYRLAPEHPHPAAVDDVSAVLGRALAGELDAVDPSRVVLHGVSAGGGLALGTVLRARDRGEALPASVIAIYPMIDDRNETPSSLAVDDIGVWDRGHNVEAWSLYLNGREADAYAAPARAVDLSALPPVYLEVGTCDLFHDEVVELGRRLRDAGNDVDLHVWQGAFHGSEGIAPDAALSRRIIAVRRAAVARALHVDAAGGIATLGA